MRYKNILFDLDGTLTDSGKGITHSVMYALEKFGIHVEDYRELFPFIGPPLKDSFKKYYQFSEEEALLAIRYYHEYFKEKGLFDNQLYPHIEALLLTLKENGHRLFLATSKPERFAKQILDYFQLSQYFDYIAGADMEGLRVEKGDVIGYLLDTFEMGDLSQTIMVGDREHDVIGARANHIDTIGVLYGYGSREELAKAGAIEIVDSVEDLQKVLTQNL